MPQSFVVKWLARGLSLVLILALLAACGGSATGGGGNKPRLPSDCKFMNGTDGSMTLTHRSGAIVTFEATPVQGGYSTTLNPLDAAVTPPSLVPHENKYSAGYLFCPVHPADGSEPEWK